MLCVLVAFFCLCCCRPPFFLLLLAPVPRDGRGISKLAMAPCVFFFMMAGPVGMLMYVVIRNARDLIDGNSMNQKIV